jgi:hypothetical protein
MDRFIIRVLLNCDENLTHGICRKLVLKIVYCVCEIVMITGVVISRELF